MSMVSTRMGEYMQKGKPSWYAPNHPGLPSARWQNEYQLLIRLLTSKDVGADMVCGRLNSCYGLRDTWKFQAMLSQQWVLKQHTLDWPAMSKYDARLLRRFLASCDLDL